jgi:ATP-dependent Lon protease
MVLTRAQMRKKRNSSDDTSSESSECTRSSTSSSSDSDTENSSEEEEEEIYDDQNILEPSEEHGVQLPPFVILSGGMGGMGGMGGSISRKRSRKNSFEELLSNDEMEYYKTLNACDKRFFDDAHQSLVSRVPLVEPPRFRLMRAQLDERTMKVAMKKLNTLSSMADGHHDGEYHKLTNWIQKLCDVPFGRYIPMPVHRNSPREDINSFLINTKRCLDDNVYGHAEAKDNIVRIVAQWISNPLSKGNVIGIHGSPGVGKTTLIKEGVCKAIGLPFAFMPLGGAHDSSYLDGHSYTYEGSTCGKIVDVLMHAGCMNPVLYFDELDKVSETVRGKEIINVLIHLTDPSQNDQFSDKYFNDIRFDLSKCLIVFTYNNPHYIDPILKDRMITIHTKDYTKSDKVHIVYQHLLPSVLEQFGMDRTSVELSEEVLYHIIERISPEAGVRNLKRALECIVSNLNLERLTKTEATQSVQIITTKLVDKYVPSSTERVNPSASHIYL